MRDCVLYGNTCLFWGTLTGNFLCLALTGILLSLTQQSVHHHKVQCVMGQCFLSLSTASLSVYVCTGTAELEEEALCIRKLLSSSPCPWQLRDKHNNSTKLISNFSLNSSCTGLSCTALPMPMYLQPSVSSLQNTLMPDNVISQHAHTEFTITLQGAQLSHQGKSSRWMSTKWRLLQFSSCSFCTWELKLIQYPVPINKLQNVESKSGNGRSESQVKGKRKRQLLFWLIWWHSQGNSRNRGWF